jgi:predicted TIM-barrel fold metal-dependent hydrolase
MIIDSHCHLKHGDADGTEYSADEIVEVMDEAGIDRSVVFAMQTTTRRSIETATAAAGQFPDRLIPYVYALPHYDRPVLPELQDSLEGGFFGIKIHAGECRLKEHISDPVFDLAAQAGAPVLMDLGGDLATARRLARDFPDTKLIVAHLGQYKCTREALIDDFISLAEQHDNVWLDASGVVMTWTIAEAVNRIGAERVLFGTDGPHRQPDLPGFARYAIKQIEMLDIADADREMVLGGSVQRLLEL